MVEKTKIITLERLTEYDNLIKEHIDNKIPTKTSELTNDSGLATENYVLAEIAKAQLEGEDIDLSIYATKDDIITKASALEDYDSLVTEEELNSKGFLKTIPEEYITESILETKITNINNEIENIKKVLTSDDVDYDTLQELVNALKGNVSSINDLFSELSKKVDKVSGKVLSTNDYTTEEKNKLKGIEEGANNYILPTDVVKDSTYKHITVTPTSVTDGTNTFNKYVLPIDVVQDGSYVHTDNNYTTLEKNKLAGLSNYDDTEIKNIINGKADMSYVDTKVANLVGSAPETLNTLKELSSALGDDPNFATTILTAIGDIESVLDILNGEA